MNNVNVLPSVICYSCCTTTTAITMQQQQQHRRQPQQHRRHVWNASYENDKEAQDIMQSIQQLKTKTIDPTTGIDNINAQLHQISKLKQDYRLVTGEEYDDNDDHDKSLNSTSNHHPNETSSQ